MKNLRIAVLRNLPCFINLSPMEPKTKPNTKRNRNGEADKKPDFLKSKSNTSLMNFARPVTCKYKPQPLPTCAIANAQKHKDVKIFLYGGIRFYNKTTKTKNNPFEITDNKILGTFPVDAVTTVLCWAFVINSFSSSDIHL